jgi:hypothetical protein
VEGRTTQKVWLTKQSEDIELDVPSKPLLVRFNEGNHLLADVIGRMWAAGELAKSAANSRIVTALMQAGYS